MKAWIIKDKNETEYIAPDGADVSGLNEDIDTALSLIITGSFKGDLSHFPNLHKLVLTKDAKQDDDSVALLTEENTQIQEIINDSEHSINLGITENHINLTHIDSYKWDNSIQLALHLNTLRIQDENAVIPQEAFKNHQYIQNIDLCCKISTSAFRNCGKLKKIILHKNTALTGTYNFANSLISNINFPDLELPQYICSNCTKLQQCSINGKIKTNAFYNCINLHTVILNNQTTEVNDHAFRKCTNLNSITILNLDIVLHSNSFPKNCEDLNIYFKGTQEQWESKNSSYNFYANIWFYSETIPTIPGMYWHFDKANKPVQWNNVNITKLTYRYKDITESYAIQDIGTYNYNVLEIPTLYKGRVVDSIDTNAFKNCNFLTEIIIPNTITEIGANILQGCNNLKSLTIPFIGKNNEYDMKYTIEDIESSDTDYQISYLFTNIPSSLKIIKCTNEKIPHFAFEDCSHVTTLILDQATDIGAYAFTTCAFNEFKVPSGVKTIGEGAFIGCDNLSNFYINENIEIIYKEFIDITKISNATNTNNQYYIGTESNPYLVFVGPQTKTINKTYTISSKTKVIVQEALQGLEGTWLWSKLSISIPFIGPNKNGGELYWITGDNKDITTVICNAPELTTIVDHAFYSTSWVTNIKLLSQNEPCISLEHRSLQMSNGNYNRTLDVSGVYRSDGAPVTTHFKTITAKSVTQWSNIKNNKLIRESNTTTVVDFITPPSKENTEDPVTVNIIPAYTFQNYTNASLDLSAYVNAELGTAILRNSTNIEKLSIPRIPAYDGARYLEFLWTAEKSTFTDEAGNIHNNWNAQVPEALKELHICGIETSNKQLWASNSLRKTKITKCTISDTCSSFPTGLFREATKLESLNIPAKLDNIGPNCFHYCWSLKLYDNKHISPATNTFYDINDQFCYCNNGRKGSYIFNKTRDAYILQQGCGVDTLAQDYNVTLPIRSGQSKYYIDFWALSGLNNNTVPIKLIIPNNYINIGGNNLPRYNVAKGVRGICEYSYIEEIVLGDATNPINTPDMQYGANMFLDTYSLKNVYVYYNADNSELPGEPWGANNSTLLVTQIGV